MVRVNVRSSEATALEGASVEESGNGEGEGSSWLRVRSPSVLDKGSCMRYDLVVYVPPTLRSLAIDAQSPVHLHTQFDDAPRVLHAVSVSMKSSGENILRGEKGLQVDELSVAARGGYLVGALSVGNTTRIETSSGSAVSKLELVTSGYDLSPPLDSPRGAPAHIITSTGTGLSSFTVSNPHNRPIIASHTSATRRSSEGDLRLEYGGAMFNGRVDVEASSFSMRGVQGGMGDMERWVGDKDGGDYVKVKTKGWLGLYF